MRHVLHRFDYPGKDHDVVRTPDPLVVGAAADLFDPDDADVD
jgi:hypothetical protein